MVYAGVTGTAFLADANPEADREIVLAARENLRKIGAQRTVLISSVNVYDDSRGKDENSEMPTEGLGAYGTYRLELENWVQEDFDDVLIVRLPALYGPGLRKNFIHDLIDPVSPFLSVAIYGELASASMLVARSYEVGEDGFARRRRCADGTALCRWFADSEFNALSFTDSRSRFQFYDLVRLWGDIRWALLERIPVLNIATPPISAAEVYERVKGTAWTNELDKPIFDYDMRTIYRRPPDGTSGYLCSKDEELGSLVRFVANAIAENNCDGVELSD